MVPLTSATLLTLALLSLFPLATYGAITEEDVVAYRAWPSWKKSSKLNFLLYDEDWKNLRVEFQELDAVSENSLELSDFARTLEDFQGEDEINTFFNYCKDALDDNEESSGRCDFYNYVLARGEYDVKGNPFDENEWSMREEMFVTSYQERLAAPDLTVEEMELLGLSMDKDGVIIEGEF